MLQSGVSILFTSTDNIWWRSLKRRLILIYLLVSLVLLPISILGHLRILREVGHTFGGFIWALDTDRQVFVAFALPNLPSPGTGTSITHVNGRDIAILTHVYQQARPSQEITYTTRTQ